MTEPPPVQRPLQVRAQEVLAGVQAAPYATVPELPAPRGPQVALAAQAHVVTAENADAGNANRNPGLPEPPLEVNNGLSFHVRSVLPLRN